MNIEDVIKVCGQLSQTPQNITNSNKKGNGFPMLAILIIGGIGYLFYHEWKRKKKMEAQQNSHATNE